MKKIGLFTHKGCDLDALCSTESMAKLIEEDYQNLEVIPIIEDSYLKEKMKDARKFISLEEAEKQEVIKKMTELTEKQKYLLGKITKEELAIEGLSIYKLLERAEEGDITPLVKHNKFQEKTAPTEENPVSCFIIGIGNNYFIKLKKLPDCDIDILEIATKCHGGGHETRCAGRFYNDTYENVLATIITEYEQEKGKLEQVSNPQKKKQVGEVNPE